MYSSLLNIFASRIATVPLEARLCPYRIGYAIARRLAREGAKVMISSRNQDKVDTAVEALKREKLDIHGIVCHVGKPNDRTKLIEEVSYDLFCKV